MRSLCVTFVIFGTSCSNDKQEQISRTRVEALAKSSSHSHRDALQRVIELGRFALVDIEQAFHSANDDGRLRLLEAIRRIGDPDALPFVQFIARSAPRVSLDVKQKAEAVYRELSERLSKTSSREKK